MKSFTTVPRCILKTTKQKKCLTKTRTTVSNKLLAMIKSLQRAAVYIFVCLFAFNSTHALQSTMVDELHR